MSGTPAGPSGEALTVLGTAAAIWLAQDRAAEELELLAAFFTALGDNLALIAAQRRGRRPGAPSARRDVKSL